MKIIKIYGGLGNQMFQYALAMAIKNEFPNEKLALDISSFKGTTAHNGFELFDVFNVSIREIASIRQILKLTVYSSSDYRQRLYRKFLPRRKTEIIESHCFQYVEDVFAPGEGYYDGYWQCSCYFEKYRNLLQREFSLRNELDIRNKRMYDKIISESNSVGIHVRRGDYLNNSLYTGTCSMDYYAKAVSKAREVVCGPLNIYVFSNDIKWSLENLQNLFHVGDNVNYIDWNTGPSSYKDMKLMSACRINIIANSSFSWWAAYLNSRENNAVIAPYKWVNAPMEMPIQCADWILL